jgi:hypothetical protein
MLGSKQMTLGQLLCPFSFNLALGPGILQSGLFVGATLLPWYSQPFSCPWAVQTPPLLSQTLRDPTPAQCAAQCLREVGRNIQFPLKSSKRQQS